MFFMCRPRGMPLRQVAVVSSWCNPCTCTKHLLLLLLDIYIHILYIIFILYINFTYITYIYTKYIYFFLFHNILCTIYVYMYVYMYMYIYIYIHTYLTYPLSASMVSVALNIGWHYLPSTTPSGITCLLLA